MQNSNAPSARISEHLRSNIVGYVALFVALTGVAAAGPLKPNKVKTKHIADAAVTTPKLADNAVTSAKVAGDTLKGEDIDESSLQGVAGGGAPSGPAGGDLTGSYPNPNIAPGAVDSNAVANDSLTGSDVNEAQLDSSVLQTRVGSSCSPGAAIQSIAANGAVTCETDDAGGPPSGAAGGDLTGSYPNPDVAPNAVALGSDTTGNYVASVANGTGITGGAAGSEGSALTLGFDYSATLAGNPALGSGQSSFGSTGVIFEGATANTSESLLTPTDPTADRTITLPNASGEASLLGQSIQDAEVDDNLTITGVDATSLAPMGTFEEGVPIMIFGTLSGGGTDFTFTGASALDRNFQIIDAWSVNRGDHGASATWRLTDGTNAITDDVEVNEAGSDIRDINRPTEIDFIDATITVSTEDLVIDVTAGAPFADIYMLARPM